MIISKYSLTAIILTCSLCVSSYSQSINYKADPVTGGLERLWIDGNGRDMNWIISADGSQYQWVGEKYHWGLGYLDIVKNGIVSHQEWSRPESISKDASKVTYAAGDIRITVSRRSIGKELIEEYVFTNRGDESVGLENTGIYTPFNDNYPNAKTCLESRCHAHIWPGGNAAYVNAVPMSGKYPGIGLILTDGSVTGYDIWERAINKGSSNTRGVIALGVPSIRLKPGESHRIAWKLLSANGWEDFFSKMSKTGSIHVEVNKYVFEKGETATVNVYGSEKALKNCEISANGHKMKVSGSKGMRTAGFVVDDLGELRFDVSYGEGKHTYAECLVQSGYENIVKQRVAFIKDHQQMNWAPDPRYGAYMVYDNENETIYLNDTPTCSAGDRTEGAERLAMGVLLAKYCRLHPEESLNKSLLKYYSFVRRGLQDSEYNTWRLMSHTGGDRGYNYFFTADYYFAMYKLTGEKKYAVDGYKTMKALYRNFGHGFYGLGAVPTTALDCLKQAGMEEEYESLKTDFIAVGDGFLKNSINYPSHEVHYEQSIVAPEVEFLCDLYLVTKNEKYLEEAKLQLPILEAFSGQQPSFHLNDIGIRHWDGYWFGKREMWGDVFPHYWSATTAMAFHEYYLCTGDVEYEKRAKNIVLNNLCLFTEDGRGSCAYIYPRMVNGEKGQFYDPYANDQDWALSFYLDIFAE